MRADICLLLAAATLVSLEVSAGQRDVQPPAPLPDIAPIYIEHPFASQNALTAFQDYVHEKSLQNDKDIEVPQLFYDAAPLITYWGYDFKQNAIGTYDITFAQRYNASQVLSGLLGGLGQISADGCSFFHAKNPVITDFKAREIDAAAGLEGKERACWGSFATDKGDIGGSATATLTFRIEPAPVTYRGRYRGTFIANPIVTHVDPHATSIFGINTDSVAGQILTSIDKTASAPFALVKSPTDPSIWNSLNVFNGELWRAPSESGVDVDYVGASSGRVRITKYKEFLEKVLHVLWAYQGFFTISDERSVFSGTPQSPVLEIAYVATVAPRISMELVEDDLQREIALIKSFSEDPRPVKVARGDTLWKLSKQLYGSPYYYHMLASANGLNRQTQIGLRPGQTLTAPPLYKLSLLPQVHFMRPGETVSELCEHELPWPAGACIAAFTRANPGLPLSHLYALEGIHVPSPPKQN